MRPLNQFLNEFKENNFEWANSLVNFLEGKRLGNLELFDIRVDNEFLVEFSVKIDELQLDWGIYDKSYEWKGKEHKEVLIAVSSPNKRGSFEKKVTGRNASNEGIWKKIESIYNGNYSR